MRFSAKRLTSMISFTGIAIVISPSTDTITCSERGNTFSDNANAGFTILASSYGAQEACYASIKIDSDQLVNSLRRESRASCLASLGPDG